jgi:hypothetical protein
MDHTSLVPPSRSSHLPFLPCAKLLKISLRQWKRLGFQISRLRLLGLNDKLVLIFDQQAGSPYLVQHRPQALSGRHINDGKHESSTIISLETVLDLRRLAQRHAPRDMRCFRASTRLISSQQSRGSPLHHLRRLISTRLASVLAAC